MHPTSLACPQVLYGMVREAAQLRPGNQDVVFDLYCGEWCWVVLRSMSGCLLLPPHTHSKSAACNSGLAGDATRATVSNRSLGTVHRRQLPPPLTAASAHHCSHSLLSQVCASATACRQHSLLHLRVRCLYLLLPQVCASTIARCQRSLMPPGRTPRHWYHWPDAGTRLQAPCWVGHRG